MCFNELRQFESGGRSIKDTSSHLLVVRGRSVKVSPDTCGWMGVEVDLNIYRSTSRYVPTAGWGRSKGRSIASPLQIPVGG